MNEIFEYINNLNKTEEAPLAYKMRPTKLEDFIGQKDIVGEGKLLRRMISSDRLRSIILYGPPGCGKTSLAEVIANTTSSNFVKLNATISGKKQMEEVVEQAKKIYSLYGKKTILFIDEIHRFNKGQQDFLLPHLEDGTIVLIGATTENPYFEVNNALLSRCMIFKLDALSEIDIRKLIDKALTKVECNCIMTEDAKDMLIKLSNGDARRMYNAIELAVLSTQKKEEKVYIDANIISECLQSPVLNYDKNGDKHYDTISAFIKSMRGSDPDATVYYLACMLNAGEDIRFISRRIMICAAEDVGLADPMALVIATNACVAVERIGMPEARIILSEAATYVALAPKSNKAYIAIDEAMELSRAKSYPIPFHLRDGHYAGANKLGNAIGYKYPHDYPESYVEQQYLPDEIKDHKFYK